MTRYPEVARPIPGIIHILTRNAERGEGWPISGDRITSPTKGPKGGVLTMVDWAAVEREDIT